MSRDKQNVTTPDCLIRGMIEKQIAKAKEKAIDEISEIVAYIKEAKAKRRDKQIEEMARIIAKANGNEQNVAYYRPDATDLYNAGYRKSEDVAEEIFAEIENYLIFNTYGIATISDNDFAELKKKYTEVAERRKGVENSPVDCSTPNVTDQKGEGK